MRERLRKLAIACLEKLLAKDELIPWQVRPNRPCQLHDGCCMIDGHAGPHREMNGLAFETNRRKARKREQPSA